MPGCFAAHTGSYSFLIYDGGRLKLPFADFMSCPDSSRHHWFYLYSKKKSGMAFESGMSYVI